MQKGNTMSIDIDKDTKLKELLKLYPWLIDEAVKLNPKFRILNNPIGKAFIKRSSIADLSKKSGLSENEIISWLIQIVKDRGAS